MIATPCSGAPTPSLPRNTNGPITCTACRTRRRPSPPDRNRCGRTGNVPTPPLTGLAATNGGLPKQLKDAIHPGLAHRGLIEDVPLRLRLAGRGPACLRRFWKGPSRRLAASCRAGGRSGPACGHGVSASRSARRALWCSGHLALSRPAPRPDVAPSGSANQELQGLPAQLEADAPMRYVGHTIGSGPSLG